MTRVTGTVKFWLGDRGYGFIQPDGSKKAANVELA
jgi:cold shock CspA family protein